METSKMNWDVVRADYINGQLSGRDLARKYGIIYGTFRLRAEKGKWAALRRDSREKLTQIVADKMAEFKANTIKDWNENDLKMARVLRAKLAMQLSQIRAEKFDDDTITRLRNIAAAHERIQRIARLALGVTTCNSGLSAPDGGPMAPSPTLGDFYQAIELAGSEEHGATGLRGDHDSE